LSGHKSVFVDFFAQYWFFDVGSVETGTDAFSLHTQYAKNSFHLPSKEFKVTAAMFIGDEQKIMQIQADSIKRSIYSSGLLHERQII